MVLYREKKRRSPWLWIAVIGVFLAFLAVLFAFVSAAIRPSDSERLVTTVHSMKAQLDVLVISHYTESAINEEETSPEFRAAADDLVRVTEEWDSVDTLVSPVLANQVRHIIEELNRSILDQRPVAEVASIAAELVGRLDSIVGSG